MTDQELWFKFNSETETLTKIYHDGQAINNLCDIYHYHKKYSDLCLKYNTHLNKIPYAINQPEYNIRNVHNYHKSIYIKNRIILDTNKIILDIYMIENNYFILEEYILNMFIYGNIHNCLNVQLPYGLTGPFDEHNYNALPWILYDSKKYLYLPSYEYNVKHIESIFKCNYIEYKSISRRFDEFKIKLDERDNIISKLLNKSEQQKKEYVNKTKELITTYDKITKLNQNIQMQLEDKNYTLENKINEQEDIIKQLSDKLNILEKENNNMLSKKILNIFT